MPDPCQSIQQHITQAQETRRALQEDLKDATPGQKKGIIRLIKQLNAEIAEQRKLLQDCRKDNPAPLRPDIGWELGVCLNADVGRRLEEELTDLFADVNGIAHADCRDGTERIGVWAPAIGSEAGRREGLEFVNLAGRGNGAFGISLNRDFINRRIRAANEAMVRAFDMDGNPNEEGPIFLSNGASGHFVSPSTIVTTVEGFRRLGPLDVGFVVTIADTFRIAGAGGGERPGTVTVDTSVDFESDFLELEVIVGFALSRVLGALLAAFRFGLDAVVDGEIGASPLAGLGIGRALLPLFLADLTLRSGGLEFTYDRVEVFPGFILAGGRFEQTLS
jgi:hypothetical protein